MSLAKVCCSLGLLDRAAHSDKIIWLFSFFFERSPEDELSPPEFSFHRGRQARRWKGVVPIQIQWVQRSTTGEGEITTAPTTQHTTINRNNKKNQHEDSRISLDGASQKTPTIGRFAPPPNSILAGFTVAIVPCTTPRSLVTIHTSRQVASLV